jgi:hypothetical protein
MYRQIVKSIMKTKRLLRNLMLPMAMVLIFYACAPTKTLITVQRAPNLNTSGIKSIAIMPFEYAEGCEEIARHATALAADRIDQMNYFTLVDPSEVERLRRNNQSLENHVDAILKGDVGHCNTQTNFSQGSRKNSNDKTEYYTAFITTADVSLNYSLVRTKDGTVVGPVARGGTHEVVNHETYTSLIGHGIRLALKDNPKKYPSENEALFAAVDRYLRQIGVDFAPYTVTERRTFAEDKSNNGNLRSEMKSALARVKEGNYRLALTDYLRIYGQYKSLAAAENASILYEALGDTRAAANIMKEVYDDTGNPRAKAILDRLNQILRDQARIDGEPGR